jgi:putative ABC transport system permease protein
MLKLLLLLTTRHLLDRPVRTTITMIGVALGIALAVAIRTANVTVLESFEQSVRTVAGRATLQISGGELGLDETVILTIRAHPAVNSATPVIHQQARVVDGAHDGQPFVIMGLDLLEAADLKLFRLRLETEQALGLDRFLAMNAVFIGARLASEWNLHVGDRFEVVVGTQRYRLRVEGVIESSSTLTGVWDRIGIMDIASAQGLFGLAGRLDRIDVETDPAWSVSTVANELAAVLPPAVTVSRPARRNEQVERMLRAFQLNLATLSAVGLLVGLLLVYNTVAFIVAQRRREIGIMRAYGMPRPRVLVLFLMEAAVIGAVGGAIGSILGLLWARSLVSILARTVSDLYVTVPLETLRDLVHTPSLVLGQGVVLGMAISVAGAMAPGLEASRTAPARAVSPGDYEATRQLKTARLGWTAVAGLALAGLLSLPGPVLGMPVFGYAAALSLLLGLSCLAPFFLRGLSVLAARGVREGESSRPIDRGHLRRVALEHLARAPGRSGVTISALMIGIAIMLGVGLMIHSFRHTVQLWINQTIMADLIVAPPSWLQGEESGMLARRIPYRWKELVQGIPGVGAVDPYREITVELEGKPSALVSRNLTLHAERSRYLFLEGDSASLLHRATMEDGVIVSEPLAGFLGLQAGRPLRLKTPSGERDLPVLGIFYDYATDGGKVVMDRQLYQRLWHDDSTTVLAVYVDVPAEVEAVRRRIIDTVGREGQLIVVSNAELKKEILAIFDRTFAITYALELTAVVIGLLGIVNTLLISTLERRRELATLRAIGASARQIKRLVLWESAYLGIIGAILGTVGGVLLALLLIRVINKQSFGWTIQLSVSGTLLVQAGALALCVSLLAAYWPARWAARQPIAEGLRYE